jgi:hypothetical protein
MGLKPRLVAARGDPFCGDSLIPLLTADGMELSAPGGPYNIENIAFV